MMKIALLGLISLMLLGVAYAECDTLSFSLEEIEETSDCYDRLKIRMSDTSCEAGGDCFQEYMNLSLDLGTGVVQRLFIPKKTPASLTLNTLDCSAGKPSVVSILLETDDVTCSESFDLAEGGLSVDKEEIEKRDVIHKRRPVGKSLGGFWIGLGIILIIVLVGFLVYLYVFND